MIESEADCIAAAAAVGVSYASNAGTEWASGCLYHNGNAYYSPHVNGTTQNPTDAYICNAASTCAPVGYWVVPTSVSERVPRSRKTLFGFELVECVGSAVCGFPEHFCLMSVVAEVA